MPATLADTGATLEITVDLDGVLTDPTAATIGIVRADGTVLAAPGTAVVPGILGGSTGVVRHLLTPANTADLDVLTVTWTVTLGGVAGTLFVTKHEIVGDLLFTERDARAFANRTPGTSANAPLANTTNYPDATILAARDEIADELLEALGYSPFPRYFRESVDGTDTETLTVTYAPLRAVRTVTVTPPGGTATAFTAPELADVRVYPQWLRRDTLGIFQAGYTNVVVGYEHGLEAVPGWCRRAALQILLHRLVPTNISVLASIQTDQTGTRQLASTSGGRFGIPEVDAIIERHADRRPILA